jgi:hypothetical protein
MQNFVIIPLTQTITRGTWANMSVSDEKDLKLEAQGAATMGKDRIIIGGWVQNNAPKTAAEFRVQIDLYDIRNQFVDTVQVNWSYPGEGEPLAPGRRKDWELATTQFRLVELGYAKARAIGRIE